MQRASAVLSAFVLAAAFAGAAGAAPLERRFAGEGAAVVVSVDPGEISPERDCEAVVRAEAEPPREAKLPEDLAGRFEGFDLAGSYADETGAQHFSLVPRPGAPRWRVKPFAVVVSDGAGGSSWFATEPFDLPAAPALRAEGAPADLQAGALRHEVGKALDGHGPHHVLGKEDMYRRKGAQHSQQH